MGNSIFSRGHHGRVKIMKLDGQMLKVKGPLIVNDILNYYRGHIILHSEAVRHMGVKGKPLDGYATLNPKNLCFLVELPRLENRPRRISSDVATNAECRLESMLLARRFISDISHMNCEPSPDTKISGSSEDNEVLRVTVRLTKAELIEIMGEREESSEAVERILNSCLNSAKSQQMVRS